MAFPRQKKLASKGFRWLEKEEQRAFPMKRSQTRRFRKSLTTLACICVFVASSAWAAIELPPEGQSANQTGPQVVALAAPQDLGNALSTAPVLSQATLVSPREMGILFPIIGLIAAVAVTQLLRRRRIAQLRSGPSAGR
jgi:hypothetical protein